jgi:Zn-dependent protease/CBS domain-containing protein
MSEGAGRRTGLQVGSVFGVPVRIAPSWLIFALVIAAGYAQIVAANLPQLSVAGTYAVAGLFVVLLLLSVFLHELGHAVVSQRLGIRVRGMTLWMLGGFTEMEREAPRPGAEFLIAVVGPVVSLVLGGAGLAARAALPAGTVAAELASQVALANLAVGVFNLLPGLPLDGGRVLQAGVWKLTGSRRRGLIAAGWAGRVLAGMVVLAAVIPLLMGGRALGTGVVFTVLIAFFLWSGASQALRSAGLTDRLAGVSAGSLARPALPMSPDTPLGEALRQAAVAGARAIVVVDGQGRPTGLVVEQAVAAVPPERRPWVAVGTVARGLQPGHVLSADLIGAEVIRAVQASPTSEYLVVTPAAATPQLLTPASPGGVGGSSLSSDARVVGVLVASDLAEALNRRGRNAPTQTAGIGPAR